MSSRISRIFQRYAVRHLSVRQPGPALPGEPAGAVETIALTSGRLVVEGHAAVPRVTLELGGRRQSVRPAPGPGGRPRFRLDLPYTDDEPVLVLETGAGAQRLPLPRLDARRLALARLALVPGFLRRGLSALAPARRWLLARDPDARAEVKRRLGLDTLAVERRLTPAIFAGPAPPPSAPPPPAPDGPVTVILPVYGAHDLLAECLDRLARHSDLDWRLLAIDDASPDPRIRPLLSGFAASRPAGQVEVLENPGNLGFIGTVNRGFAHLGAARAPVVLLNTDALVPAGWLSRLVAPMLADPGTVASVTPMSNDAELTTVPVACVRADLGPGEAEAMDRAASGFAAGQGLAEAPTGVGFCMAMNPRFLAEIPLFDTAFGKGYGEEVDWCRKAMAAGGRHLYTPGLVVEHRGGASFGSAEKQRLLARNGALISSRYPGFDLEVQDFLAEDPLATPRLALGLALHAARGGAGWRLPVYLAHALGGGAETWLARRIAEEIDAEGAVAVIRVGGATRWQLELHTAQGMTWGTTDDRGLLCRLLAAVPARRVVYSCGVGDRDPVELPDLLVELASGPGDRAEVLLHDYFPLSPSYALTGADGLWRGLPEPGAEDAAHRFRRPDGSTAGLADWRAAWGRLMDRADRVTAFCEPSRALALAAYPGLGPRLEVVPHRMALLPPRVGPPAPGAPPVIGVLGNLAPQKGAGVVAALSRRLARSRAAGLVLIGQLDPAYALAPPARIHGSYAIEDLPALVRRYGITCWLIPSIWPETFSFTTREALATGLPVWCFDLGAQAEAVAAAVAAGAPGGVIPLADGRADSDAVLARMLGTAGKGEA